MIRDVSAFRMYDYESINSVPTGIASSLDIGETLEASREALAMGVQLVMRDVMAFRMYDC